jgi:hypothetical protein
VREKLVHRDTFVSDGEVVRRAAEVTPGSRVHARHILLLAPPGSSAPQRDSVRAFAQGLVGRIRRGESFEQLAREHSADRATAEDGGDLGWFGPGELVAELERAAFALPPGSVSDVVESAIGLHIIRVDEVEAQSDDEVRAQVRSYIQQLRVQTADSALIADVEKNAAVHIEEGAAQLARRAAENPGLRLSRRARERALVTYAGGKVTVGEIAEFMQSRANQFRIDILNAPDETLEQNLLAVIAQRELLVAKAREEGIEVTQARQDSLAAELHERVRDVARGLELVEIRTRTGESDEDARERKVQEILGRMISGARDVVPLGSFSFVLREMYSGQVYPTGIEKVVARIAAKRGPPLRPDTAAGGTGGIEDSLTGPLAPLPGGSP